MARAHRVALELHLGRELSNEEEACHDCDNPPCCNPAHLFVGTHADNMGDYASKGYAKGSSHSRAKLLPDDILEIKSLHQNGMIQREIAELFHINQSQVSRILNNRTGHTQENSSEG